METILYFEEILGLDFKILGQDNCVFTSPILILLALSIHRPFLVFNPYLFMKENQL